MYIFRCPVCKNIHTHMLTCKRTTVGMAYTVVRCREKSKVASKCACKDSSELRRYRLVYQCLSSWPPICLSIPPLRYRSMAQKISDASPSIPAFRSHCKTHTRGKEGGMQWRMRRETESALLGHQFIFMRHMGSANVSLRGTHSGLHNTDCMAREVADGATALASAWWD